MKESIEDFIERGGQVRTIKTHDDRYASHTSRFHFRDSRLKESPIATAPGGRIEPGLRYKSWSNRKKKRQSPPAAY